MNIDDAIKLIDKEIDWSVNNSNVIEDKSWADGFIKGLVQAKTILELAKIGFWKYDDK